MNITIIGGDSRIIELIKLLKKENDIFLFGIEKSEELNKENHISEIEEALEKANIIITSIPLSHRKSFCTFAVNLCYIIIQGVC